VIGTLAPSDAVAWIRLHTKSSDEKGGLPILILKLAKKKLFFL